MHSSIPNNASAIPKSSFLKRLCHSYRKDWRPLLAAKKDLGEEYTFASGHRASCQGTEVRRMKDGRIKILSFGIWRWK
jgi:hypothetical protein